MHDHMGDRINKYHCLLIHLSVTSTSLMQQSARSSQRNSASHKDVIISILGTTKKVLIDLVSS